MPRKECQPPLGLGAASPIRCESCFALGLRGGVLSNADARQFGPSEQACTHGSGGLVVHPSAWLGLTHLAGVAEKK